MEERIMELLRKAKHFATRGDQALAGSYFQKAIQVDLGERGSFLDVLENETFAKPKEAEAGKGSQGGKSDEGVQEGRTEDVSRKKGNHQKAGSGDRPERGPESVEKLTPSPAVNPKEDNDD